MRAIDISEHFLSQAHWVDPVRTVDGIIVGRPDKEVKTILVTWISSLKVLNEAVARGFDAVMTHEPTFYDHAHEREAMDHWEIGRVKKRLVEENDLVVIRNHDCWDKWPRIGIPWAWGQYLGLGEEPAVVSANGEQLRYDIEPVTLDSLAACVAAKTALMGEPFVQVAGDGERKVSKVGIGTGCGCRIDLYREMGCDVSIVCDDGTCWWGELQRAVDMDMPVIRVNHGSSEDPGMVTLTKYINENLDGVTAVHRPHQGYYRLIPGRHVG